jgi:hypothetical protein
MQTCGYCSRFICFDQQGYDDLSAPAYVTESGDVMCRSCGKRADEEDWEEEERYWDDEEEAC